MFGRLKDKWNVNGWRLFLILITFALGGSICGWLGRRLMNYSTIEHPVLWTVVYIILITVIWPLSVLLVSIPMGQFNFFKKYLRKMVDRMKTMKPGSMDNKKNLEMPIIAILASGTGTNARRIIEFSLQEKSSYKVGMVVCNKPGAGVISIAESYHIPVLMIEKEQFFRGDAYVKQLKAAGIDFIVLAGFLWKIPAKLVEAYRNHIINIHPALLPNYGGKGMYGQFVHEAVIANKDTESGITIHWVDELYDHGSIIFQARCPVFPGDTPTTLAARIHELEHKHYPVILNQLLEDIFQQ